MSWYCNFAIGIPHHNNMYRTVIKELVLQFHGLTTFWIPGSQKRRRTMYPMGLHGQRGRYNMEGSHGISLSDWSSLSLTAWQCGLLTPVMGID